MLHGVDDAFMFPALDASFLSSGALGFDGAALAGGGPVVMQELAVLDAIEPPGQQLSGWAAIDVVFGN
jgi:hypothetical protein